MDRLALFETALAETEKLQRAYPAVQTLTSVANQLKYLISLASGQSSDRSRLGEIILGVQAAREVESLDPRLADHLYEADDQARQM